MTRQLTPHFTLAELTRSEAALRKGLDNTLPDDLLPNALRVAQALEAVRAHYSRPIRVTSCYRAPAVNKAVGGSPTSAHRFASAADFEVDGIPHIQVCRDIVQGVIPIPDFDQVIYEFGPSGWVHIGFTHGPPRRMALTARKQGGKTVYAPGISE